MAKNQEANQLTSRQRIAERYRGRNPEINVDDDEVLGNAILGDLEAYDKAEEQRRRFNETVQNSDIAPEMMAGILSGKNPDGSDFHLDEYLLDKHIDYLLDYVENSDTAKEKFNKRRQERQDEEQANADALQKAEELAKAEDAELDAAMQEAGYKPEQVMDLVNWLYGEKDKDNGFVHRVANFELKKDDFLKLFKIKDFDTRLADAEQKGYKRGRNEKIDMFRRGQKRREDMPADINGEGGVQTGTGPKDDPTMAALKKMKNSF